MVEWCTRVRSKSRIAPQEQCGFFVSDWVHPNPSNRRPFLRSRFTGCGCVLRRLALPTLEADTRQPDEMDIRTVEAEAGQAIEASDTTFDPSLLKQATAILQDLLDVIRKQYRNQIQELAEINVQLRKEVNQLKDLRLELYSRNLDEVLSSLKEVLKERDQERVALEKKVLSNVRQLVLPYLEHLRQAGLAGRYQACIEIIESNLNDLVSPFSARLSSSLLKLTPTEIRVANLVKEGKGSKEIAELLCLSQRTIDVHRDRIRKKLGLKNQRVNLRTYLAQLE